jgi:hypothetical protein
MYACRRQAPNFSPSLPPSDPHLHPHPHPHPHPYPRTLALTLALTLTLTLTLTLGITEADLRAQDLGNQDPLAPLNATQPWPLGTFFDMDGDWPADVDRKCVEDAIDIDFTSVGHRARSTVDKG